ncbi:hypothetical protein ES703_75831 [subsurface metagenome]
MPADYGIDEVPGDWSLVTVKYMVVGAESGNLEEEASGLIADGDLTPARLAADHHRFLPDVVLEEGAHLTGPHSVVHYQGQYCPITRVFSGLKKSHQLAGLQGSHERLGAAWWVDGIHGVGKPVAAAHELEESLEGPVAVPPCFRAALNGRQKALDRLGMPWKSGAGPGEG